MAAKNTKKSIFSVPSIFRAPTNRSVFYVFHEALMWKVIGCLATHIHGDVLPYSQVYG